MGNNLFFNNIKKSDINRDIISKIENYIKNNSLEQMYLITAPLGAGKVYTYEYEKNVIVILSPKHKIIFLYLTDDEKSSNKYYKRFISDLGSISDKIEYKEYIGYVDEWEDELIITKRIDTGFDIKSFLEQNKIEKDLERKNELVISLLMGSYNDIDKIGIDSPKTVLDKVKNKIILFDAEQSRFIYQKLTQKKISIQGLSGTGKTELLLHKLKEIYTLNKENKIFFTCHNNILANTLKNRVKDFFDFMKVGKQIPWNEQLWVDNAWGSQRDKNSGLYTYICHFYNIPFSRWSNKTSYEKIFTEALEEINKIDKDEFKYAFDYILIDERQDFPNVFFELCEKITKQKVYIAGDIFQDIFDHDIEQRTSESNTIILNKCYRTDPKTLMFAHSIGMGLFEKNKLNWLTDEGWKACGYTIKRSGRDITLSRDAIRRFEDLEIENILSMNIERLQNLTQIINIIKTIKDKNPTVKPDDIAIIILDTNKSVFDFINKLEFQISEQLNWIVNKSYESKRKIDNTLFISNKNNVKGLEFPFVICITAKILDNYNYRNTLYTMLTRSFLQSFLLVKDDSNLKIQKRGLKIIQDKNYIQTIEPTEEEKEEIKKIIIKAQEENNISFKEFLYKIFEECETKNDNKKILEDMINANPKLKGNFDENKIKDFIYSNENYVD